MGGLLHLVQRGGAWAGWNPVQSFPRCIRQTDRHTEGNACCIVTGWEHNNDDNDKAAILHKLVTHTSSIYNMLFCTHNAKLNKIN